MLASITAITHMIIAIINDSFRLTGLLTVIALVLTGLFGMLFYKLKKKIIIHSTSCDGTYNFSTYHHSRRYKSYLMLETRVFTLVFLYV